MNCTSCGKEIENMNGFKVKKNKSVSVEQDSIFCPDCWNNHLNSLSKFQERFKRLSKSLMSKAKVMIEGIVQEDPQIIAYGSGHEWVSETIYYIFPLKMTQLNGAPEGVTSIPVKPDDVFMVEFKGITYVKKSNIVEVDGYLINRNYLTINQSGFVFEADKIFNLTYGYSTSY